METMGILEPAMRCLGGSIDPDLCGMAAVPEALRRHGFGARSRPSGDDLPVHAKDGSWVAWMQRLDLHTEGRSRSSETESWIWR